MDLRDADCTSGSGMPDYGYHLTYSTSKLEHSLFVPNRTRLEAVQDSKLEQSIPESAWLIQESSPISRIDLDRFGGPSVPDRYCRHRHDTTAVYSALRLVGQHESHTVYSLTVFLSINGDRPN